MHVQNKYLWTKYILYTDTTGFVRAHINLPKQNDSAEHWSPWISTFFSAGWITQPEDAALEDPHCWNFRSETPVCFYSLSIKIPIETFVSSPSLKTFYFIKSKHHLQNYSRKKKKITKPFLTIKLVSESYLQNTYRNLLNCSTYFSTQNHVI